MEPNGLQRDLQRVIVFGSSLAGGALAALLQALRPHLSFEFSVYTVIAFVAGMAAFMYYWRLAFAPNQDRRTRRLRWLVTAVLIVSGFAGVLYPLRFVDPKELPDLITGLVAAALALGGVFFLLYLCGRFLERDHAKNADWHPTPVPPSPKTGLDEH